MVHLSNISKQYGNKILYRYGHFQINNNEKIGLVGPNGAGKTTLFRLIMEEESPDSGTISKSEKTVIGYFSQNIEEMRGKTVIDEVMCSVGNFQQVQIELRHLEQKMTEDISEDEMSRVLARYGELHSEFERVGGYDLESRAAEILSGLGFSLDEQRKPTETFSGGWKMRIALAKILLQRPDVLLMDEPTNHLDMESIIWLENWLIQFQGALMMTCHDRDFMNRIVSKIVEVAHQAITSYSGNYDFYDKERALRREQLIAAKQRQDEMLAKEEEFIARFAARASHAAQVQSRVKKIEKIDRIEIPPEEETISFEWPTPPRGGDEVVKFENLGMTYTPNKKVFSGATGLVKRLDRVAVVGVNGAGKSTLLKLIAGQFEPSEGKVTIGSNIQIGYFSQNSLDILNSKSTVLEEVQQRIPNSSIGYVRNLLGAFKFSGEEVEKKISILSGGEKSRVVLACILAQPVNLLVLDEPTNHLDIASREVLLEAIQKFPGTVIIVSHDRHFLRAITNKVFELDRQHLQITQGDWNYYCQKLSQNNLNS